MRRSELSFVIRYNAARALERVHPWAPKPYFDYMSDWGDRDWRKNGIRPAWRNSALGHPRLLQEKGKDKEGKEREELLDGNPEDGRHCSFYGAHLPIRTCKSTCRKSWRGCLSIYSSACLVNLPPSQATNRGPSIGY